MLKLLGIRWPGEVINQKKVPGKTIKKERPVRPQELPWPENLITEIGLNLVFPDTNEYKELSADQLAGLIHVFDSLKENEQTVLRLRYEEHKTFRACGDVCGLSTERMRQITANGLRKLRNPARLIYYRDGLQAVLDRREQQKIKIRTETDEQKVMDLLYEISFQDCLFSVRVRNCLTRAGYSSLGDVAYAVKTYPEVFMRIRNLGRNSFLEVLDKLEEYGIDTRVARIACNCN